MYNPISANALFANEDMSVYGPKAHQRIISKLNSGLGPLYYHQHSISLEPLPATMLNEGEASPVPDLILYDNDNRTTPIIIEVCHTDGLRRDLRKVIRLIDEDDYGIIEGFVYDYMAKKWFRYRKGDGALPTESSYSDLLTIDLNQFL